MNRTDRDDANPESSSRVSGTMGTGTPQESTAAKSGGNDKTLSRDRAAINESGHGVLESDEAFEERER
jgi:hypothetical protein